MPNNPLALGGLVRANYCLGRYEETYAAAIANWTGRGQPEAVAVLEGGYAEGGFAGAMSALARWKQEHAGKARASHLGAGVNYAMAGKSREALDQLELAFEERDPNVPYLGVWVEFRSLKNEPRFQELLRRMNLPSA